MTKQLEKKDYTFQLLTKVKSSTIEDGSNQYPNVYLTYECSSGLMRDKHTDMVNANGCTNLERGVTGVYNDVEHEGYFAKGDNVQKARNAGDVVDIWVENDILYAKSRVGIEHDIYDRSGQKIGSSYASAWLTYAKSKVNEEGGNVFDYIPPTIKAEFFDGQTVLPYKAVSIEAEYGHYLDENNYNLRKQLNLNKYDITAITFLYKNPPAQIYSNITSSFIKSMKNNQTTKQTLLKCLCDLEMLQTGSYLIDKVEAKLYFVSDSNDDTVEVINVETEEVTNTTLEDLKGDDKLDVATIDEITSFMKAMPAIKSSKSKLPKSVIKACQMCAAKKGTDWRKNIDAVAKMDVVTADNPMDNIDTTQVQNQANDNEIGILRQTIIEMGKTLDAVLAQVDMIVNSLAADTSAGAAVVKSADTELDTLAAIEARLATVEAGYESVEKILADAIIEATDEDLKTNKGEVAAQADEADLVTVTTNADSQSNTDDTTDEPVIKAATIKSFVIETNQSEGFVLPDIK